MNSGYIRISCVLALLLAVASANAAAPKPPKPGQPQDEVVKEGKILVVRGVDGAAPQLTDAQSKRWLIIGPLAEEIRRLHGHTVKGWGSAIERKELGSRTFKPGRYRITDSGGRAPVVGILRDGANHELLLQRAQDTTLGVQGKKIFLKRLRQRLGCKVWIVGDLVGGAVRAFKFGWLSCKTKPLKSKKETQK